MKRYLLALVPWMALASSSPAQTRLAEVSYTHHDAAPVHAYRLGDECFVPLDSLDTFGWRATVRDNYASVNAEGKSFSLPTRVFSGKPTIPMRKALSLMGAGADWVPRTDTLQVFAPVSSVVVHNGRLQTSSTLGLKPSVFLLSNPGRLVVDFEGARLSSGATKDLDAGVRVSQYKDNVIRVILDAPNVSETPRLPSEESRDVDLDLKPLLNQTSAKVETPGRREVETKQEEEPVKVKDPVVIPKAQSDVIRDLTVRVDRDSETGTALFVPFPGLTSAEVKYSKPDPDRLMITLPRVHGVFADAYKVGTDAVTAVMSNQEGWNTVLVFQLARPMGVEVVTDATGLQIRLFKPRVGDGKLAGKTVVVDPGHGGQDSGSNSGGVIEKNLTLAVGKLVAEELAREGAVVIMTRKDDSYPSLTDRATLANRNNADYFISVHINKTAGKGETSTTGSITFYHGGQKTSEVLAECIQREIAKVSQLPGIGVWSDTRIYDSGFSVLRNTTKMPGVLVELGFINNARDRKRMVTSDFHKVAAAAIVKGLKVYLGDGKEKE